MLFSQIGADNQWKDDDLKFLECRPINHDGTHATDDLKNFQAVSMVKQGEGSETLARRGKKMKPALPNGNVLDIWPGTVSAWNSSFNFNSDAVDDFMFRLGIKYATKHDQELIGCRLKMGTLMDKLNSQAWMALILDAIMYTLVVMAPVFVFLYFAFEAQVIYSRTTAVVADDIVNQANWFGDDVFLKLHPSKAYYPMSFWGVFFGITSGVLIAFNMLMAYCVPAVASMIPDGTTSLLGRVRSFVMKSFSWILTVLLWVVMLVLIIYIATIALWILSGAIIYPNKGLLLLSGVFTVVNGVRTAVKEMRKIVQGIIDKYNQTIENAVEGALVEFQDIIDSADTEFTFSEFFKLAVKVGEDPDIGVEISPTEAMSMFEFADVDGSGSLSSGPEVNLAFELWKEQLIERERIRLGVADKDLARDSIIVFVMLVIIFIFIYSVVNQWAETGVFQTVVSSSIMLGTGAANAPEPKEMTAEDYAKAMKSVAKAADRGADAGKKTN